MVIRGLDRYTQEQLTLELEQGGRFVFYEYCISVIFFSLRKPTDIYFLPARDLGIIRGLPYALVSLFFGWWGIPWGLIYTPLVIFNDLAGGCDVTEQVVEALGWYESEEAVEEDDKMTR